MRIAIGLIVLCLTLSLCGCYSSDGPLLDVADAVTPLPEAVKLVGLDAGGIAFDELGKMSEMDLYQDGKTYRDPSKKDAAPLSVFPIAGRPGFYLLQQTSPTATLYVLGTLNGNRASLRAVEGASQSLFDAKMKDLKLEPLSPGTTGPLAKVSNREQLVSAADFEATLPGKDASSYLVVPYPVIRPLPEGLAENHSEAGPDGFSPAYWYNKGFEAEYGTAKTPIDLEQAAQAYRKAAEGGVAGGMVRFGQMLEDGKGVPADTAKAIEWYQKAAMLGTPEAALALGKVLLNGVGVARNPNLALYFFRVASASGSSNAAMMLADMFDKGDVVPADKQERLFWLVKAAEGGDGEASRLVSDAVRTGDGTSPNLVLANHWPGSATSEALAVAALPLSASFGREFVQFAAEERHYYMMGLLDMLWSIGDRLTPNGLDGDCAEGYAMDNVADTPNGLSATLMEFAKSHPVGNVSEVAANYVYGHCDKRRNVLLLDFYVLNFSGANVLSDTNFDAFVRGALSGAVQAHLSASKKPTADCIENYYDDDDAYHDLLSRTAGDDVDLVTTKMMQQLDGLCP